jgi:hypothetical protein
LKERNTDELQSLRQVSIGDKFEFWWKYGYFMWFLNLDLAHTCT